MKRIAIVCPIGKTGNVVTMTINCFLREKLGVDDQSLAQAATPVWLAEGEQGQTILTTEPSSNLEIAVIVPHTQISVYTEATKEKEYGLDERRRKIIWKSDKEQELGELQRAWEGGQWHRVVWVARGGYKWLPQITVYNLASYAKEYYQGIEARTIRNIHCYLLPIHRKDRDNNVLTNTIVEDIDDAASDDQFQDLIYGLCAMLERQGYSIHLSLAGGRKTMSAYQMTAGTLFPVEKGLSHVLEPTFRQLEDFIGTEAYDNLRSDDARRKQLEEVQVAYQPYPELYVSVPVQHISLAGVSRAITNRLPGFAGKLDLHINTLSQLPLDSVLLKPGSRKQIYEVGRVYREHLGGIDRGIARKIEQGIAGGMLHSFLKHEVKGQIFRDLRQDLDILQSSEGLTNMGEVVEGILAQIDLFEATLSAIQIVTDLDSEELKEEIERIRQHESKTIVEIIKLSLEMYRVKDHLRAHFLTVDRVGECTVAIHCHQTILALAFNNIFRNLMKEIRRELNQLGGRKSAEPPYRVTISVHVEDDQVTLRFEDNGPGFPPEFDSPRKLERLFQMDFSTHHADGESQGLGLPIVRKIIQAHGGEIHAERNQPNGAVFVVTLPRT